MFIQNQEQARINALKRDLLATKGFFMENFWQPEIEYYLKYNLLFRERVLLREMLIFPGELVTYDRMYDAFWRHLPSIPDNAFDIVSKIVDTIDNCLRVPYRIVKENDGCMIALNSAKGRSTNER